MKQYIQFEDGHTLARILVNLFRSSENGILFRTRHGNGRINFSFYARIIQDSWNSFSLSDGRRSRYSRLVIQRTGKRRLLNRENTFFTRKWIEKEKNDQCLAQLRFRNNYIHLFVRFYSILGRFFFCKITSKYNIRYKYKILEILRKLVQK